MIVSNEVVHDPRVVSEATSLVDAGIDVTVIGWDRKGRYPSEERWKGFDIIRVRNTGLMKVLAKDLFRNPLWWRLARMKGRRIDFDVIHCHDLDTLWTGVKLKKEKSKPLIYDAHEVFGYMIEWDVPAPVVDYAFRLERKLAPEADGVVAANSWIGEYLEGLVDRQITVVMNCKDPFVMEYQPPPEGPFTLFYAGSLHEKRFVREMVKVAREMDDVVLTIAGEAGLEEWLKKVLTETENVRFLGKIPQEQILPMTLNSHAVPCMFDPRDRNNQIGTPNKIFEAMATGRPVIATKGIASGELVEREGVGIAVEYSREAFRDGVATLKEDEALSRRLGTRGLEAAKKKYNWTNQTKKLLRLYDDLM